MYSSHLVGPGNFALRKDEQHVCSWVVRSTASPSLAWGLDKVQPCAPQISGLGAVWVLGRFGLAFGIPGRLPRTWCSLGKARVIAYTRQSRPARRLANRNCTDPRTREPKPMQQSTRYNSKTGACDFNTLPGSPAQRTPSHVKRHRTGLGCTCTPKMKNNCIYGCYFGFRAIILHTLGV